MRIARWYAWWKRMIGATPVAHEHTMECTPSNCDMTTDEYIAMRHRGPRVVRIDARQSGKTLAMDRSIQEMHERHIEVYREALRPFARMHREGDPPNVVMLTRGKGQNVSFIRASDFDRAFYLLDEHNI